jgi:hypothetical protein
VESVYDVPVTKPPEGLGVRLVSAGPLFFFLAVGLAAGGCAAPGAGAALHEAVQLHRELGQLHVQAEVACTRGDLEQVCCALGTREHESLLMTRAPASSVQAGLLALGMQAGRPGSWRQGPAGELQEQPPQGSEVDVRVRWQEGGVRREAPIGDWLDDRSPGADRIRFVFAGSRFVRTPGGERFAADLSGSIVGLVTFGDEVIACAQVVPDRADVAPPRWRARGAVMPPEGTPVTLVLGRPPAP